MFCFLNENSSVFEVSPCAFVFENSDAVFENADAVVTPGIIFTTGVGVDGSVTFVGATDNVLRLFVLFSRIHLQSSQDCPALCLWPLGLGPIELGVLVSYVPEGRPRFRFFL